MELFDLVGRPVVGLKVTELVRVYRPRDSGEALIQVRLLGGTLAGTVCRVPRERVSDDQNQYVQDQLELTQLVRAMEAEWFLDAQLALRPIPFQYPKKYCWARAYQMAKLLKTSGYKVSKVLLIDKGGLRVESIFGDDLEDLGGMTTILWWYHIAPIVYLGNDTQPFVIDPSLLDAAQSADQWVAKMTAEAFEVMPFDGMRDRLRANNRYPKSPKNPPWLVWASAEVAEAPPADDPDGPVDINDEVASGALAIAADRLPRRFAVGALNLLRLHWQAVVQADGTRRPATDPYREYLTDLTVALSYFRLLSNRDRGKVVKNYPNLLLAVRLTFADSGVRDDITNLLDILDTRKGFL
ncbi:MAG: hypothetical protein V7603_6360 [Micromonosporaceae bacterium]